LLQNCSSERKHAKNAKDMHVKNRRRQSNHNNKHPVRRRRLRVQGSSPTDPAGASFRDDQGKVPLLPTEELLTKSTEDAPNKKAPERKKKKLVVSPDSC
jgi:hypothetical protein